MNATPPRGGPGCRSPQLTRRALFGGAFVGVAGLALTACSGRSGADRATGTNTADQTTAAPTTAGATIPATTASQRSAGTSTTTSGNQPRLLLAYFSRAGENFYNGGRRNLTVGNTEVLANTISRLTSCAVYRVEAAEPYPEDYDGTVARNVREEQANARPKIAQPLPSLDRFDTVLLASPVWNVRAPMIMSTFTEGLNFSGKTVHAVVTYAVSGLGSTERDYRDLCKGATVGDGLAVRGETVADAEQNVRRWLQRNRLA